MGVGVKKICNFEDRKNRNWGYQLLQSSDFTATDSMLLCVCTRQGWKEGFGLGVCGSDRLTGYGENKVISLLKKSDTNLTNFRFKSLLHSDRSY